MADYFVFDDEARAIRVLRPDTPQAWINYLSNDRFHAFVSQAGGGLAWWHSPLVLRLTRYRQYNLPLDTPGFYIYLRGSDGVAWSPTWRPCETALDRWEASHRPGVTTFEASRGAIDARLSLFVAPDDDALVWDLSLTNRGSANESLDVFAYVEHSQLNWEPEPAWGYYCKLQLKTWHDEAGGSMNYLCHTHHPRAREVPLVFFGSSLPAVSYSGSRHHFVGDYRSERNPIAVERCDCGNDLIDCGEPAAALHGKVALAGGATQRAVYALGVAPGALVDLPAAERERDRVLGALLSESAVDEQAAKRDAWWAEHLGVWHCSIPDEAAQRQINTWSPVNSVHTGRYSRSVNTSAPGVRGIGFRDTCQDMLAVAYRRPAWAARVLKFLLSQQYPDGHTVHYTYPEERKEPTRSLRSDNHLWPPLVAHAIISETGEAGLLDEKTPYLADDHCSPAGEASVWDHLMAGLRFTESNLGGHGIPLTFHSDWNDIIGRFNRRGKGETVFAGMQFVLAMKRMLALAEMTGRRQDAAWLAEMIDKQTQALEACAWDGDWWRRGFDDDGNPVGSAESPAGKLFLNPQSWAVLSGLGTNEQRRAGMDAVGEQLDTGVGLKILTPSFESWSDESDGEGPSPRTGYGPGCGENGAIFCHANTWAIIAESLLGRGDRAWGYFMQLIPANAMAKVGADRYRAEPYAWVSNIVGPDNNRFGWANVEQITGTAPWMDVAATQYLLGIRPEPGGLRIDPCLPGDWPGFTVTRRFRGRRIDIETVNETGDGHGVKRWTINDQDQPTDHGALVGADTLAAAGAELTVRLVV